MSEKLSCELQLKDKGALTVGELGESSELGRGMMGDSKQREQDVPKCCTNEGVWTDRTSVSVQQEQVLKIHT